MAQPMRRRILDDIATTVAAITTGGGYNFSVGECKRGFKHFNNVPEDKFPACYVAGADEKSRNSAQRTFTSDVAASIVGYVKQANAADEEALERDLDNLAQDLRKALMVDVTRGGYAVTTEIVEVLTDKGAFAPYAGLEMIVNCEYRASVTTA